MLKKTVSYLGVFVLVLFSLLPLSVLYIFADVIYFLLFYVFQYRRKVVVTNLTNAFPEKSQAEILSIEKEYYHFLASLIVETVKMNTITKKELLKRCHFINTHRIANYLQNGQSILVCSAHYGNWEWGALAMGLVFSAKSYPIYKPLSNPIMDHWLKEVRSRFGNSMVAMRQTLRALQESAGQASIFCFGNDQAPAKNESLYWLSFLHQQTAVQLGIEKIAKKTNRPIFYLKVKVLKRGFYEVDCVPLFENPKQTAEFEITATHIHFLEEMIKAKPAYWLWSHRRWKHQPTSFSCKTES